MEQQPASLDEEVDWAQFDPPEALGKLPNIASEVIIAIVQSSVENIRAQVEAEKQRKVEVEAALKEEAEAAAVAEEEAAEANNGKGKAVETDSHPEPAPRLPGHYPGGSSTTSLELPKAPKRARFGMARIWNRVMGNRGDEAAVSRLSAAPHQPPLGPTPFTQFVYKHLKPSTETVGDTVECVSCLDDIDPKAGIKTTCHHYCKDCFVRLIQTALENEVQWPPKCCLNTIPFRTIAKHVPDELLKSYRAKDEEFRLPVEHRLYCSQPDCGIWIREEFQNRATKTATCPSGHVICTMCRGATHPSDEECPQDRDQQLADRLAEEEGWRRCDKCAVLVEHREACQHMTCRCGNEFCYVCGARWRTCSCTMEQLAALKDRAAQRRLQRTAEEEAEAREITEALRLVAQFQAQEDWKAEVRRAALQRQREERMRREAEERARREEARLAALDTKYQQLALTLKELNDLQRMVLTCTHDGEMHGVVTRAKQAWDQIEQKQEAERLALQTATRTKRADLAAKWDREYADRVAWEARLERDYEAVLTTFWGDMVGGQDEVRAALDAYVHRNDARLDEWQRVRDRALDKANYLLDDELAIQEELMGAARDRLRDALKAEAGELGRKLRAETKWFELVVAERARLLAEVEMVDRESGGEGSSAAESSDEGLLLDDLALEAEALILD